MKKKDISISSVREYFEKKHGNLEEFIKDKCYELPHLAEAATFIKEHLNDELYVIGDYDVDGITSSLIMKILIERLGGKVNVILPKRLSQGYGICKQIVEAIPNNAIIITVDNGIAEIDSIDRLRQKGCKVLVTDHHLPVMKDDKMVLPNADLIINPHVYKTAEGFEDYCGAGVALKISKKLLSEDDVVMPLLEAYAAIGTVADVMPLVEENRTLVKRGLEVLNHKRGIMTRGLEALLYVMKLSGKEITAESIAYYIAPAINSAGRMEDDGATNSFKTLYFNGRKGADRQTANKLAIDAASALVDTNNARKDIQKKALEEAERIMSETPMCPILVYVPTKEGIIGPIAGNLAEKYHMPAFVVTDGENGVLKGSARGVTGVHLKNLMDKTPESFLRYGGHEGAAGFSIKKEDITSVRKALEEALATEGFEPDRNTYYDLDLDPKKASDEYSLISKMEPLGEGNEKPVFHMVASVDDVTFMGEGKHIRISLDHFSIVGFNLAKAIESYKKEGVSQIEVAGFLSENEFRGVRNMQLIVNNLEPMRSAS